MLSAPSTDLSFLRLPRENWVSIWPPAITDGDVISAGFFLHGMSWTLITQRQQKPVRGEPEKKFPLSSKIGAGESSLLFLEERPVELSKEPRLPRGCWKE